MFSPAQTSTLVDTLSLLVFLSSCVELRFHFVHRNSKSLNVYVIGLSHSAGITFHKSINPYACVYTNNLRALCLFRFCVTAPPDCSAFQCLYFLRLARKFSCRPKYDFCLAQKENAASNVRCDCCCSFRMQKIVMSSHDAPTFAHAQTHTTTQLHHSQVHKIHEMHCKSDAHLHTKSHAHSCPCHCSRTR